MSWLNLAVNSPRPLKRIPLKMLNCLRLFWYNTLTVQSDRFWCWHKTSWFSTTVIFPSPSLFRWQAKGNRWRLIYLSISISQTAAPSAKQTHAKQSVVWKATRNKKSIKSATFVLHWASWINFVTHRLEWKNNHATPCLAYSYENSFLFVFKLGRLPADLTRRSHGVLSFPFYTNAKMLRVCLYAVVTV